MLRNCDLIGYSSTLALSHSNLNVDRDSLSLSFIEETLHIYLTTHFATLFSLKKSA